jgi:hypothetical protein
MLSVDNSDLVCQIRRTLVMDFASQLGIDIIAVSSGSDRWHSRCNIGCKTGILCYLSNSTGENEPECYDTRNTQSDDTAATPKDRIDIGHEE